MAVSTETKGEVYGRAGGRCECTMSVCDHHRAGSRCPRSLVPGYWDVHQKSKWSRHPREPHSYVCNVPQKHAHIRQIIGYFEKVTQ